MTIRENIFLGNIVINASLIGFVIVEKMGLLGNTYRPDQHKIKSFPFVHTQTPCQDK